MIEIIVVEGKGFKMVKKNYHKAYYKWQVSCKQMVKQYIIGK